MLYSSNSQGRHATPAWNLVVAARLVTPPRILRTFTPAAQEGGTYIRMTNVITMFFLIMRMDELLVVIPIHELLL